MQSVWIPPQQKTTKDYVRWTTHSAFVIFMLWLVSYFYDEYRHAEYLKLSAIKAVEEVHVKNAEIEARNAKIDEHNNKVEKKIVKKKIVVKEQPQETQAQRAPELPKTTAEEAVRSIPDSAEPVAGGAPMPTPPKPTAMRMPERKPCTDIKEAIRTGCLYTPPKEKTIEVEEVVEVKPTPIPKESKIEIDTGIVKVAMSNEASWMAIIKIVFTVLFTFFGVKLINFGFRKLEKEPQIA